MRRPLSRHYSLNFNVQISHCLPEIISSQNYNLGFKTKYFLKFSRTLYIQDFHPKFIFVQPQTLSTSHSPPSSLIFSPVKPDFPFTLEAHSLASPFSHHRTPSGLPPCVNSFWLTIVTYESPRINCFSLAERPFAIFSHFRPDNPLCPLPTALHVSNSQILGYPQLVKRTRSIYCCPCQKSIFFLQPLVSAQV